LYDCGDLLDGSLTYGGGVHGFNVEIGNNGRIWILGEEETYLGVNHYYSLSYLSDYFYQPLFVMHHGVGHEKTYDVELYKPTFDNVVKMIQTYANGYTDEEETYGIPLDAKGNVIVDPYFNYDVVTLSKYDELPEGLGKKWIFVASPTNAAAVVLVLDDLKYVNTGLTYDDTRPIYLHDFEYVHPPNTGDASTLLYGILMLTSAMTAAWAEKKRRNNRKKVLE